MKRVWVASLAAIASLVWTSLSAQAKDEWALTHDVELISRWPQLSQTREDRVTADLYRPRTEGRVPAAVIINSSGGVSAHTELYYARLLAEQGVAALVVDSFRPRGVRRTSDDQWRVFQSQSDADAAAGFRWLAAQPWVDAKRIIVMGMSRGGNAALDTATESSRRRLKIEDAKFAAHVAITPGCAFQEEVARSTGAPIFFMLAELDDYTFMRPCLEYADRLRAAGNAKVRLAVYPGVYHAHEATAGLAEQIVERGRRCSVLRKRNGALIDRHTGKRIPAPVHASLLATCIDMGPVTVGGDPRVKSQSSADLLQFLRDVGIIEDAEARAVVPDCAALPEGIHRRTCERARAGWTGDLVALGRAYRYPSDLKHEDALAARLFQLAADRDHPQAQWELSLMYRQGAGVARDAATALRLASAAAATGDAAALNIMGVMARDGIGQQRDDVEAVRWFRRAADLNQSYALANLGRMHWEGRGGLSVDRAEAVKLFRRSAYYENPLGQLNLAEALEKGDGTERDVAQAVDLYKTVAEQNREPDAKRRGQDALSRLGATLAPAASPKR